MYLTRRFYIAALPVILLIGLGYFNSALQTAGLILLCLYLLLTFIDIILLYTYGKITATRECSDRFSNGEKNRIRIPVISTYPFRIRLTIIDEIPAIFQRRDIEFPLILQAKGEGEVKYSIKPTERGVYGFGNIRLFAATPLGLVLRRYTQGEKKDVKVYPSYLMLSRYELMAMSNNLTEMGIKKIRKVAQQTDFEQIRDYVQGDEYRTINWKATARRNSLMVNVYQDERSQPIINLIDKGRVMQQAFNNMTLLDYAINASLVLSYIVIKKDDKAGLMTFSDHFDTYVAPEKNKGHMQVLMEKLYAQQTRFEETDYSELCIRVDKYSRKRSLLILYTNFSDLNSLQRQLPYLRQMARKHCLLVVFFEDTDLNEYLLEQPKHTEAYYQYVIGEKFAFEKKLIVNTLRQNGIYTLLTSPDGLTVNVINKYLELKARQLI